jgi:hypothetical protein
LPRNIHFDVFYWNQSLNFLKLSFSLPITKITNSIEFKLLWRVQESERYFLLTGKFVFHLASDYLEENLVSKVDCTSEGRDSSLILISS